MIEVTISPPELYDENTRSFINKSPITIRMEHSLVSLKKWEAKYKRPFLNDAQRTPEETIDYFRFMTITKNVPNEYYNYLSFDNIEKIKDYITDSQSATVIYEDPFADKNKPKKKPKPMTAEVIYGYMVVLQIPWEAQCWHLNQLLTLINVVNDLNKIPSKKTKGDNSMAKNYAELNARRLKQMGTKG